ncbi:MAG: molecular chaperone Hsp90 [Acidobacteria bacterium]|nr:molecular chaperone Hsp90 [Acidobacteriota bacterium]
MTYEVSEKTAKSDSWRTLSKPTIGKDILELLSSSMYIDPLTIYREYIQNAADSIDEARSQGLYGQGSDGKVKIHLDLNSRSIRIQDNGIGVRKENFESQLGTFGGSLKRGTSNRGFRGVGRLAGLGYCQSLIFRTRAAGESLVSEMLWDCRKIKQLLQATESQWSLEDLLSQVVTIRHIGDDEFPTHFFEVEMCGVIRHKSDVLLNHRTIYDFLSEVAPVPFHPDFSFGPDILSELEDVSVGDVSIEIEGEPLPVYRPFRDSIEINDQRYDHYRNIEIHKLPALDDGTAAMVWFLHHSYKGSIPDKRLRGVRVRCGNIQIGDSDLFLDSFAEPRFNSWTVGEVHVLDLRLVPNGRRDHFEMGVHFDNLANQITPLLRNISSRCRKSSATRNRLRELSTLEANVLDKLNAVINSPIDKRSRYLFLNQAEASIVRMRSNLASGNFDESAESEWTLRIDTLESKFAAARSVRKINDPLESFSAMKRNAYERVFGLILECSENQEAARKLIDRIVAELN